MGNSNTERVKKEINGLKMSRTDFDQMLLESVNEAISTALGRPITPELLHYLQAHIGVSVDEMPDRVDLLFQSLMDTFGTSGDDLCKLIVKKMYAKAGVPFYEIGGQPMIRYVEELKARLAKTNP
jgi:hypothetical protein